MVLTDLERTKPSLAQLAIRANWKTFSPEVYHNPIIYCKMLIPTVLICGQHVLGIGGLQLLNYLSLNVPYIMFNDSFNINTMTFMVRYQRPVKVMVYGITICCL